MSRMTRPQFQQALAGWRPYPTRVSDTVPRRGGKNTMTAGHKRRGVRSLKQRRQARS
jgi:hypothetical protein